jgi:hypothetical protein
LQVYYSSKNWGFVGCALCGFGAYPLILGTQGWGFPVDPPIVGTRGYKKHLSISVDICRLASYLGATLMVKISRRPAGLHRQNETTSRATSLLQFVQSLCFSWEQGVILLADIFLNHSSHSSVDKANMSDIIWLMVPNVPIFFACHQAR